MDKSIKISVLLPVYNEPVKYLSKALKSMQQQTYDNLEIIVILDNPKNKEAASYVDELVKTDSRIIFIKNENNLGLPASLNRGISKATGELIARMDADDIASYDRFDKQISELQLKNLDLVASNVLDMDENGKLLGTGTKYPLSDKAIKKYLKYGDPMPHPTWLGKRRMFEELAGYRQILACEDYDFIVRACLSGYKLGLIKEPLVNYRINQQGISKKHRVKQISASRTIQHAYRKHEVVDIDDFSKTNNCRISLIGQFMAKLIRINLRGK